MGKLIQSHMVLPFLNDGTESVPDWVQIQKATEWNTSFNAETEDRKYISDRYATTEVMRYKPSVPVTITAIEGEKDYDLFNKIRKEMPTGEKCKKQLLVVRLGADDVYTEGKEYEAQLANVTIVLDSEDTVSSQIAITIHYNGTPTDGTVTFAEGVPAFTKKVASV